MCNGAADSFVPRDQIDAFTKALSDAKIDWQFTNADARIKLKRLYPLMQD